MKTLLETLNMTIEESAEELMGYAKKDGMKEVIWADLEMMICNHIDLSPSDIGIINESMREADYPEGIIYDDVDDIENADELEADYDEYDRYYIADGSSIKGYQYHELNDMIENGEYYETKRFIARKLMEEETAQQIVDRCNEMLKEEDR